MSIERNIRLERSGNITNIHTPEAHYTIIYKAHLISRHPQLLPENIEGFF